MPSNEAPPRHQTLRPDPSFHCRMSLHGSCQALLTERRPPPACLPSQQSDRLPVCAAAFCLTSQTSVRLSVAGFLFVRSRTLDLVLGWPRCGGAKGGRRSAQQWEPKGKCRSERKWGGWRETQPAVGSRLSVSALSEGNQMKSVGFPELVCLFL